MPQGPVKESDENLALSYRSQPDDEIKRDARRGYLGLYADFDVL